MTDGTMFTQLTISVQGKKASGKKSFANQVLVPAIAALGGTVVQNRADKMGAYVTCTLPANTFAAAPGILARMATLLESLSGKPDDGARLGDDVELRDGVIRAKAIETCAPGAPSLILHFPDGVAVAPSHVLDGALMYMLEDALAVRRKAVKLLASTPDDLPFFGKVDFVAQDKINALMRDGARAEIAEIDARLAVLGFRAADAS